MQIHKVPGFLSLLLQVVMSNEVQIPVRQSGRKLKNTTRKLSLVKLNNNAIIIIATDWELEQGHYFVKPVSPRTQTLHTLCGINFFILHEHEIPKV